MIVVDAGIWIDALRGNRSAATAWLTRNIESPELTLTDLTFCEVLQGMRPDEPIDEVRAGLLRTGVRAIGGVQLADDAASNYRLLRKRGITVRSTIDCMVATFCIRDGHRLLHNDRDFEGFERYLSLKVVRV